MKIDASRELVISSTTGRPIEGNRVVNQIDQILGDLRPALIGMNILIGVPV